MIIFLCSPNRGGVTDHLAATFMEGAKWIGLEPKIIALRDYAILPCTGCQACSQAPWQCILKDKDDTDAIYRQLLQAKMVIFSSPIYFYALPAHFKAFIDRSQKFWNAWQKGFFKGTSIPAQAILAAGRPKGNELFSGSLRTLRWFGKPLGLDFEKGLVFRGLDKIKDLQNNPQITKRLFQAGSHWGRFLLKDSDKHENCQ